MPKFFDPTPEQQRELEDIAAAIPGVQKTFVVNHPQREAPDRGAHQQQIAGVEGDADRGRHAAACTGQPRRLSSTPIRSAAGRHRQDSTGLGCPHAETDADFLGLMVAFRTRGRTPHRPDHHRRSDDRRPTRRKSSSRSCRRPPMPRAPPACSPHRPRCWQAWRGTPGFGAGASPRTSPRRRTGRCVRRSAYQRYWTGIVRARDVLGKFTFVPASEVGRGRVARCTRFTDDWRARQSAGDLAFDLRWIPFIDDRRTPAEDLTRPWAARSRGQRRARHLPEDRLRHDEPKLTSCWRRSWRKPRQLGRDSGGAATDAPGHALHRRPAARLSREPAGASRPARSGLRVVLRARHVHTGTCRGVRSPLTAETGGRALGPGCRELPIAEVA